MEKEIRITTSQLKRAKGEDGEIVGMAARVGKGYNMGWFEERIEPGAFDNTLGDDVRVLFNHDGNMVLGRTKSGTARIWTDEEGNLMYSYKTPNRSYAKDLEDAIRTGDVDQSSFAFVIEDEEWRSEEGKEVRVIKKIGQLYDVSPVTYPANPDTSVAKRSYEEIKKEEAKQNDGIDEKANDAAEERKERSERLYSLISNTEV